MSDKIIVVSMAKNEADIIESFVRYYMTFVDGMVIVDHNSDDDTGRILAELQKEYPALIVDQLKTTEYVQWEVMTNLVKIAANELEADWVLPLDIDEYLIPRDGADCRSLLENIADDIDIISLNWIDHELVDMDHDRDIFLLSRSCKRSSKVKFMTKVFIKGNLVRNSNMRLIQGNHGAIIRDDDGKETFNYGVRCPDFILAHFPFRSQEQYVSKNAVGWLTNSLKYSATTISATDWKTDFDKICNNDYEMPRITDGQVVGPMYNGNIELKYTDSKPINVLSRVMRLAEKICDQYAKHIALEHISTITVIMPLGEELEAVVDTIGSLLNQTISIWQLIIIAPDDLDASIRTTLLECDSRIRIASITDDITPEGYVKLITPGVKLIPDCLEREATVLELHSEFNINLTYSNRKDAPGADITMDRFGPQYGNDIWEGLKDKPYSLTGGVSGMMLRKIPPELQLPKVIENYHWKEKEILGILLPEKMMLVFSDFLL